MFCDLPGPEHRTCGWVGRGRGGVESLGGGHRVYWGGRCMSRTARLMAYQDRSSRPVWVDGGLRRMRGADMEGEVHETHDTSCAGPAWVGG